MKQKNINYFGSLEIKDKFLSGSLWTILFKFLAGFFGLLVNILLVRILTPSEVGWYFLTHSLITIFSLIAQFGLPQLAVRLVAENLALNNVQKMVNKIISILCLGLFSSTISGLIFYLFVGDFIAINLFNSPEIMSAIMISTFWLVSLSLQAIIIEIFRGLHDIRIATFFHGAFSNILLFFIFFIIWNFFETNYISAVKVTAITFFITMSSAFFLLLKRIPRSSNIIFFEDTSSIIKESFPLWITTVSLYVLVQADLWIIGYFSSPDDVALYGAASRLIIMISLFTSITYSVLPPIVSELNKTKEMKKLQMVIRGSAFGNTALVAPLFLFIFVFPGEIMELLFDNFYRDGGKILAILAVGKLFNIATGMRGYVLMLTGHGYIQMYLTIFAGIANIVFCIVGIKLFGILGVALGATLAMIFQCTLEIIYVKKKNNLTTHLSYRDFKNFLNDYRKS